MFITQEYFYFSVFELEVKVTEISKYILLFPREKYGQGQITKIFGNLFYCM